MRVVEPVTKLIVYRAAFTPVVNKRHQHVGLTVFESDFQNSIFPDRGRTSSFTRNTGATVLDFEHKVVALKEGEPPFEGARRVKNLFQNSENLEASTWIKSAQGAGSAPVFVSGKTYTFECSGTGGADRSRFMQSMPLSANQSSVVSIDLSANTNVDIVLILGGHGGLTVSLTSAVKRFYYLADANGINPYFEIRAVGSVSGAAPFQVTIGRPQFEDVAGQTNQNPSEYVSTGVVPEASPNQLDGLKASDFTLSADNFATDQEDGSITFTKTTGGNGVGATLQFSSYGYPSTPNIDYVLSGKAKVSSGSSVMVEALYETVGWNQTFTDTEYVEFSTPLQANGTNLGFRTNFMAGGEEITLKDLSFKVISHGSNVDGIKCFKTFNANTVTDGTVHYLANGDVNPDYLSSNLLRATDASDWIAYGTNIIADESDGSVSITYVDQGNGGVLDIGSIVPQLEDASKDLVISYQVKVNTGSCDIQIMQGVPISGGTVSSSEYTTITVENAYDGSGSYSIRLTSFGAGQIFQIKAISVKEALHNTIIEAVGPAITSSNTKFAQSIDGYRFALNWFDTPTQNIRGDLEVWVDLSWEAIRTYQGTGRRGIAGTFNSANINQDQWGLFSTPQKTLMLGYIIGASYYYATSTVTFDSIGLSDNERIRFKITRVASTGVVTFYYSFDLFADSPSWIQFGNPVTGTSGDLDSGTEPVRVNIVGGYNTPVNRESGRLYDFRIYDGIGWTLVTQLNPNDYVSGSTWSSSSTGETWTISGNANIFEGNKVDAGGPFGFKNDSARTNQVLNSENFDSWLKVNTTVSSNAIVAPDGNLTGDRAVETADTGNHTLYTASANTTGSHTFSIFAKQGERKFIFLFSSSGAFGRMFNLVTGELEGTVGANAPHYSTIEEYPDGWFRCSISWIIASAETVDIRIGEDATTVSYLGDVNKGLYLWGAQLEHVNNVGAYASYQSSYLKTTTTPVTRNSNYLQTPAERTINLYKGSVAVEIAQPHSLDLGNNSLIQIGGNGSLIYSITNKVDISYYYSPEGNSSSFDYNAPMLNQPRKAAITYDGDIIGLYYDSVTTNQGTFPRYQNGSLLAGNTPTFIVWNGYWLGASGRGGYMRKAKVFDYGLSAEEVEKL